MSALKDNTSNQVNNNEESQNLPNLAAVVELRGEPPRLGIAPRPNRSIWPTIEEGGGIHNF